MERKDPLGLPVGSVHAISLLVTVFTTLISLVLQEFDYGTIQLNAASKALLTMSGFMLFVYDHYRRHQHQIDTMMEAIRQAKEQEAVVPDSTPPQ